MYSEIAHARPNLHHHHARATARPASPGQPARRPLRANPKQHPLACSMLAMRRGHHRPPHRPPTLPGWLAGWCLPVEGGGAPAQLVDDDQRVGGGGLQDGGRLDHLRHEGRDAALGRVARTHPDDEKPPTGRKGGRGRQSAHRMGWLAGWLAVSAAHKVVGGGWYLARMASTMETWASSHGTKDPTCAMSTMQPSARM